jgi:UDP-N-acetylmuramoyl-L-alanyl-D-glutamate--2,6-diaminopimelate ligase
MYQQPFSHLFEVLGIDRFDFPDILISNIVADSRKVIPGSIFIAASGENTDGHLFISDAIQRGASIVIGTKQDVVCSVPYIKVVDSRIALASLSAAFYNFPARKMQIIGVTGTDGKTTTINLIFSILEKAGVKTGMISTVNARIGNDTIDTGYHVTTPGAPEIQHFLFKMASSGMDCAIIETTSHGLEQKRVAGCEFDIGVITNITHEHLDYHGTFEKYREAKADLFKNLSRTVNKEKKVHTGAVLNHDDQSYSYLKSVIKVDTMSYGKSEKADFRGKYFKQTAEGIEFTVFRNRIKRNSQVRIRSKLFGEFNLYNCLAALSTTVGIMGIEIETACLAIEGFKPEIPGRMERIDLGQNFTAIVDFAHTPNALKNALGTTKMLRDNNQKYGRIIAIFGSAGLRDRLKRKMMAEISAQYADLTILTAEDPRTESLEFILSDMKAGMEARGGVENDSFRIIPDRGEAIQHGVDLAKEGDIVIVCGKGHEQSMCFGEVEYPWDDRTAVRSAIAKKLMIKGPDMPYLPTSHKID